MFHNPLSFISRIVIPSHVHMWYVCVFLLQRSVGVLSPRLHADIRVGWKVSLLCVRLAKEAERWHL